MTQDADWESYLFVIAKTEIYTSLPRASNMQMENYDDVVHLLNWSVLIVNNIVLGKWKILQRIFVSDINLICDSKRMKIVLIAMFTLLCKSLNC